MKRVVVLGATGHTGSYLTEYLCGMLDDNEYEIIASGKRRTDFFNRYGIDYVSVDISQKDDFDRLPREDVFAVILLSGVLPAYMQGYDLNRYITVNSIGALNTLEYCRSVGADRILYAQTISDVLRGVNEKNPLIKPYQKRDIIMKGDHTVYALSKCLAVDLIEHYHQQYGLKGFVFRLPTIYAYTPDEYYYVNGERRKLGYRIIIDAAIAGGPLEIWGDPTRAKDIVYVRDFCQLLGKAVVVNGVDGGWFNVGTGVGVSTEDQIRGIAKVFAPGETCEIVYRPDKPSGPSFVMDISNCRELLGYRPQYDYLSYLRDFKKEMKIGRFDELRMPAYLS